MRITLALEDDAAEAIQAFVRRRRVSLGKAASELIRRGARYQLRTRKVNGIPVLEAPEDFPVITSERVRELSALHPPLHGKVACAARINVDKKQLPAETNWRMFFQKTIVRSLETVLSESSRIA